MKNLILTTLLMIALGVSFNCDTTDDQFEQEKEQYIQSTKLELKRIEDRLIALRERADNILTENQEAFQADLEALSKAQNEAEQKLEEIRNSSRENWEKQKKEMNNYLAKLDSLHAKSRDW